MTALAVLDDARGTKVYVLCSTADCFLHLLPNVHLALCRRAQRQAAPVRVLSHSLFLCTCSEGVRSSHGTSTVERTV